MQEDGRRQVRLPFGIGYDWFPAWPPDDTHLAFQSNHCGDFVIWIMGADGGNPVKLTQHSSRDIDPAWTR